MLERNAAKRTESANRPRFNDRKKGTNDARNVKKNARKERGYESWNANRDTRIGNNETAIVIVTTAVLVSVMPELARRIRRKCQRR